MHGTRVKWCGVAAAAAAIVLPTTTAGAASSGWVAGSPGVTGPVSSFSDTDAWALGSSGFAHWNGANWQQVAAPSDGSTVVRLAMSDDGPTDAWAVGAVVQGYGRSSPRIEHWNGTGWSISTSPAITARHARLSGVAALSSGNAWAVGNDGHNGLVEHWNGTGWSRVEVPDPNAGGYLGSTLTAVSARSASDIWAIGTFANNAPLPDSLYALHFDGTAWHIVPMAQTGSQTNSNSPLANSVVAIAPNDVWVVGASGVNGPTTLTEHWNGAKWTIVPSPFDSIPNSPNSISDGALVAVTARASNDVWAAGYYFTFTDGDPAGVYHALLVHWDGVRWTQDTAPTTGSYNTIQGISSTLGGHRIWATNSGSPGLLTHQ